MRLLPMAAALSLTAMLALGPAGWGSPALAQEAAPQERPQGGERPPESIDQTSEPDWPEGLENWDTPPRDPEGDPEEAERRGLTSEDVKESLPNNPTEQGTRPPPADTEGPEVDPDFAGSPLYGALNWVRRAPPDLEGNPVPRPNWLAREPLADEALTFPDPPASLRQPAAMEEPQTEGQEETADQ